VLEGINSFAHMLFAAFGLIAARPNGAFGAMALRLESTASIGSLGMLLLFLWAVVRVVVVLGALARFHGFSMGAALLYPRGAVDCARDFVRFSVMPRLLLALEKVGCNKKAWSD
jgi:Na+/H+-dicarboxylate symporter